MKTCGIGLLILCFLGMAEAQSKSNDSLYPLKCGTYVVTAHVQKSTPQWMELVIAKGAEAETILKIKFPKNRTPKFFFEDKKVMVTGKIKLTRQAHPYVLEGLWLSRPITEKYRKTDFIVLKESLTCEK